MSQQQIAHSLDLLRLQNEAYHLEIKDGYLLVKGVPYVNSMRAICYGTFVCALNLAGDVTIKPNTHVAYFKGDHPCDRDGVRLEKLVIASQQTLVLKEGIEVQHTLSSKPFPLERGYTDYYEMVTTYLAIISNPAKSLDASVSAQNLPVVIPEQSESVFCYTDTASTRAGISAVSDKLALGRVGIVGLGGTGSYILDLVAKTPVKEIHLFDADVFSQHNAFRSPGAPNIGTLKQSLQKVKYFKDLYSNMHRHITSYGEYITAENIGLLNEMDFVFISIDNGPSKSLIISTLENLSIPFIDVGMGIFLNEQANSLGGILRTTTSTRQQQNRMHDRRRISFSEMEIQDEYAHNIQIADLNALNAALAVIKWKKLFGFYLDLESECHSTYTIDGNILQNEDQCK